MEVMVSMTLPQFSLMALKLENGTHHTDLNEDDSRGKVTLIEIKFIKKHDFLG